MINIVEAKEEDLEQICQLFNEYDKEIEDYYHKMKKKH